MPFTSDNAQEMGRRGVQARRENAGRRAALGADTRAREVLASSAEALARELLNAALGRGNYAEDLKPKDRLQAVIKALEWGVGRPIPANPPQETTQTEDDAGIELV